MIRRAALNDLSRLGHNRGDSFSFPVDETAGLAGNKRAPLERA